MEPNYTKKPMENKKKAQGDCNIYIVVFWVFFFGFFFYQRKIIFKQMLKNCESDAGEQHTSPPLPPPPMVTFVLDLKMSQTVKDD